MRTGSRKFEMTRCNSSFISRLRCGLIVLSLLLCIGRLSADERPNFVWLVSEDNSKHFLKLFDENGAATPNIARLAKDGLIFNHAFSNAPVCSVARTTLITGCYAPRIGAQFHRRSKLVPMPAGLKPFPEYLRDTGYYTSNRRKTDFNIIAGKNVWDESSNKATWRKRKDGQPFFHFQSFGQSHEGSLHFPRRLLKNEKTKTDPTKVFIPPIHPDNETFRYTYARYHDRIKLIDEKIGEVVEQLEEDGLLESTFVFYFGDHGGVLPGSKGYAYETGLHVPLVIRIPEKFKHLVDGKRGQRVDGFVSFVDFGPTLLHLAGIEVPKKVDGRPFLGKDISLADVQKRDETFGYADRFDEKYDLVRTLRKGNFKYIRNYQPFNFDGLQNNYRYKMLAYENWRQRFRQGKLNAVQSQFFLPRPPEALYDLAQDPYETRNLAGDAKFAEKLVELRTSLSNKVKRLPDLSFYPESVLFDEAFENPTRFGNINQKEIADMVTIADLSLLPFAEAEPKIAAALASDKPWFRYWGLIVCSSFGNDAKPLVEQARKISETDSELLNRVRAAEFLALVKAEHPRPVIKNALAKTKSGVEACLILNTLVLLQDGKPGYELELKLSDLSPAVRNDKNVQRRLQYLVK